MKVIKQIFKDDLKSLFKHFFALVIAIGICFLPALYAWFNIYSNWDPYGNTGGLKLAAFSCDEGCVVDDEYKNQGDSIIENLKENTAVDWQFVDSKEQALSGVEDGSYYAAVIIDEKFSYNMYNVLKPDAEKPALHFVQNQKKNPVANKITDTVVSTLQNNINEAYVEVLTTTLFSGASDLYDDIEENGGVDSIIDKLREINKSLDTYQSTLRSVEKANAVMAQALANAQVEVKNIEGNVRKGAASLGVTGQELAKTQETLNLFNAQADALLGDAQTRLDKMESAIEATDVETDAKSLASANQAFATDLGVWASDYDALLQVQDIVLYDTVSERVELTEKIEYYNKMMELVNANVDASEIETDYEALKKTTELADDLIRSMRHQLNNVLVPNMNNVIDHTEQLMADSSKAMISLAGTLDKMGAVFTSLQNTVIASNDSLEKTASAIAVINERLSDVIQKVDSVTASEKLEVLIETLTGDPDAYGEFFKEPVAIESHAIYPISNYGSAVAPFYTTLAIWVGSLITGAIVKAHPDKKKYKGATKTQTYFGRYLLFLLVAQIQSLIIVIGDLALLKIQCVEVGRFFFASAMAALVFSLLIYSLIVSFGDVGKAFAVVIVVLQIAGSSGTYPIELLPEFFQKVYIFFPFPYAINAMRECLCGMYEHNFTIYLLRLLAFIPVSLFIGILLRIPFEEVNHFMEERMEETEMM